MKTIYEVRIPKQLIHVRYNGHDEWWQLPYELVDFTRLTDKQVHSLKGGKEIALRKAAQRILRDEFAFVKHYLGKILIHEKDFWFKSTRLTQNYIEA